MRVCCLRLGPPKEDARLGKSGKYHDGIGLSIKCPRWLHLTRRMAIWANFLTRVAHPGDLGHSRAIRNRVLPSRFRGALIRRWVAALLRSNRRWRRSEGAPTTGTFSLFFGCG